MTKHHQTPNANPANAHPQKQPTPLVSRRTFIAAATIAGVQMAAFGLSGCAPQKTSTDSSLSYKAGTYTGLGEGKFGKIIVDTTFSDAAITHIEIVDHGETERISDRAFKETPLSIIENQSLGVDTITGATLTSAAIITAVTDCAKQAEGNIKALKNNYTPPALSTDTITLDADIVIAGAGAAGMASAIAAAQNGAKKVIVLEKGSTLGGNALVSGGYLEYVNAPDTLRPPMTEGLTRELESELSHELTAGIEPHYLETLKQEYATYRASGTTKLFDSLHLQALQEYLLVGDGYEGLLGFAQTVADFDAWLDHHDFKWKPCIGIVGYPWPRWSAPDEGVCGQGYFNFFDRIMKENKYPVEIMLNTPATELIKENGKVTGIIGVAENGTTYRITSTRGVILATGGFSGNPDMLRTYNTLWDWSENQAIPTTNVYGHTGDGITMALDAGATVDAMDRLMMFPFADCKNSTDETTVGSDVDCLIINTKGERFINETLDRYTMTKALMEQPEQKLFLISDADTSRVQGNLNYYGHRIDYLIENGQLYRGDTLEELASLMGCDPKTLATTVEKYNESARTGDDPDFGRITFSEDSPLVNPPFYASPRTWAAHITEGGVIVDEQAGFAVLDKNEEPIEGLYAVGEITLYNSGVSSMALGFKSASYIFA